MTIADKLTTVAENQQKVFDAGKRTERDDFWEMFQRKGEPAISYYYAFAYEKFNDENYNPKYAIDCSAGSTGAGAMFYNAKLLTNTKVPIILRGSASQVFGNCSSLTTIPELQVDENVTFSNAFNWCQRLTDLTMTGVLASSINLSWSPLSVDSMKSVIFCLKDLKGTDKEGTCTLTLSADRWAALEADSTGPNGGTWENYVTGLGWAV